MLEEVPFAEGVAVEVIVLERPTNEANESQVEDRYPLRGKLLRYDDPFGPAVPPEDWEAMR